MAQLVRSCFTEPVKALGTGLGGGRHTLSWLSKTLQAPVRLQGKSQATPLQDLLNSPCSLANATQDWFKVISTGNRCEIGV